ncbi:hypothetical protein CAPTEDRAFT_154748 [Capitella teleta]|uniref:Mitochondrial import inner membrane translocase subunit n=1 Tax=Capitella teleta TaxID=283909 RepID=R7UWA7_CAPTE|nr:hypothetical protein CAPTEDRAFT_154748 [Capitella teleta]|eukprot:ELU08222.1 hypothetical protein CAPTEDRAFT_154748 [Capitella teleta]
MAEGDPQLQRMIAIETQKQEFQQRIHDLTEKCWDTCMLGVPGQRLDRKTETCIGQCVQRFIDASNFVVNRLEKEGQANLRQAQDETGGFKWQ